MELHKVGLCYDPDEQADDCLDGLTDRGTLTRIQSMMEDAYNAFMDAEEDIHGFILELDADYVANAIKNQRDEQARIILDSIGRDMTADENRECGEIAREIARLEKLQATNEVMKPTAVDTELRIDGRTRDEFITRLRTRIIDADRSACPAFGDDLRDALQWLELS